MATHGITREVSNTVGVEAAEFMRGERRRRVVVTACGGAVLLLLGVCAALLASFIDAPQLVQRGELLVVGLVLCILGVLMVGQSIGFAREDIEP